MNDAGRTILIVVLAIIALPLLWGGIMMGGMGSGMMGGWGGGDASWSPWRAVFGMVSTVVVIGGIGAIVVWAFGRSATGERPSDRSGAQDILNARYARGEITREQYQQMRGDLES